MKKKLTVVLLIVALLLSVSGQIAAAGDGGMVTVKQFTVSNMPEPKAVHYFNKVIDLGNGLKGEMLIGKGEKTYMDVWKPNSGKRDLYVWNGSQWVYLHSITDIVPGFEKPMTINTYKYATWDEYTHTVPTDDNPTPNPNPPSSGLTVSLSGPAKLGVNQKGKYTATVSGGTPPYTLTWSSDGYVSSANYDAYYKWSAEGKYTVTVAVRDLNGQTATASMDVTVESWKIKFSMPDSAVWYFTPDYKRFKYTPDSMYYGIYVDNGTGGKDNYEIVQCRAYNTHYDTDLTSEIQKFKDNANKRGIPSSATVWWTFAPYYLLNDGVQVPLGDVTFDVKVKEVSTGKVKEATHTVHVDFAVPVTPSVNVGWKEYSTATQVEYLYPLAAVGETQSRPPTTTVYVKWVKSNHLYATDDALMDAYHGGDSSLTTAAEELASDPSTYSDGSERAPTSDAYGVGLALDDLIKMDNLEGQFTDLGSTTALAGHATKVLSDGSTKPVYKKNSVSQTYVHLFRGSIVHYANGSSVFPELDEWVYPEGGTYTVGGQPDHKYKNEPADVNRYPILVDVTPDDTTVIDNLQYIVLNKNNLDAKEEAYVSFTLNRGYNGTVNFHFPQAYNYQKIGNNKVLIMEKHISKLFLLPKFTRGYYADPYSTSNASVNNVKALSGIFGYTTENAKIVGIEAIPSSLTFDSPDSQSVTVEFIKDDGSRVSPTGSQVGVVKDDQSGEVIALWQRGGYGLRVTPVSKGSGNIHLSGDDLGGPYGIDIPVTVTKDFGSFSITVNGTDWNDLKQDGWLSPQSVKSSTYGKSMYYEYGIYHKTVWWPWFHTEYITGLTDGGTVNNYGQFTPSWYKKFTERSESDACQDLADNQYALNVKISASSNIKVRFTVQYGDTTPIVLTVSGSSVTKNLTAPDDWIISNLENAGSDATVQSVTYEIEVSVDNGKTWTTIKTGTDVLHFKYDANLG